MGTSSPSTPTLHPKNTRLPWTVAQVTRNPNTIFFSSEVASHSESKIFQQSLRSSFLALSPSSGLNRLGFENQRRQKRQRSRFGSVQQGASVAHPVFSTWAAGSCYLEASEGRQATQPPEGWGQLSQFLGLKQVFGVSQLASQGQERAPANQPALSLYGV